jgi:sugar transferase (PEP-CTERM/EpsH1 system associated)
MLTMSKTAPAGPQRESHMPAQAGLRLPVRVMHVMYSLRPGGMELGVAKLVNGLDPSAIESTICSTTPGGDLKPLIAPGVPVFELNRRQGNDPKLVWDLYRLFQRTQPDVVHTHAWGTLVEGLTAARLARVPAVVHGEHGTLQLRTHQRWVQRRAWAAADRVLSVSSRLAERIARETKFPLERITTIRNGVDISRFGRVSRGFARKVLDLHGERVAVTVGRLVPVKDHMTLLESMAISRRRNVDAVLAIAGDGPLRSALEARASALGLSGSVRFLGHRPDVEIVLAAADVFVMSSESEGLSNTVLEAMASALPVAATRVGGTDEMVLDGCTGLLVDPHSPEALAAALSTLFENPDRARAMGAAGRARAESEFSLPGMIRRYETLYRETMTNTPRLRVERHTSLAGIEQSGAA